MEEVLVSSFQSLASQGPRGFNKECGKEITETEKKKKKMEKEENIEAARRLNSLPQKHSLTRTENNTQERKKYHT